MSAMMELLSGSQYITEMLVSCLVVMAPHRKKRHFLLRAASFSLAAEVISMAVMNMETVKTFWQSPANVVLSCVIFVLIFPVVAILFMCFCCPASIKELIYAASLCQCMQHFSSALQLCLFKLIPDDGYIAGAGIEILSLGIPFFFFYFLCIRELCENGSYQIEALNLARATIIVILVAAFVSVAAKGLQTENPNILFYVCQIYEMLCCVLLLWIQVDQKNALLLQHELDMQSYLKYLRHEQYTQSKKDIDMLTHLMHDLSHQVSEVLSEKNAGVRDERIYQLEKNLMIYENSIDTNNEILNIALKERNMICREHNISLMCIADGEQLDFVKTEELYLIFRNALDNAIESVCKLKDVNRRIIDVRVFSQQSFMVIQIENEFEGRLRFRNGLPLTTKEDRKYHGYGLKTIRQITEQYMGFMTVRAKDNRFCLQIMMPIPS